MSIPSLPFLPTASLPEVVWILASLFGLVLTARAWGHPSTHAQRLKHAIRALVSILFLVCGVASAYTPPAVNPTWLSVFTPITIAVAVVSMALLSVIDEQAKEA